MAAGFAISQPGISKHVRVLESSGLIRREVIGRVHRCRIEPEAMQAVAEWLDEQRRFWSATLDRLETYIGKPRRRKSS